MSNVMRFSHSLRAPGPSMHRGRSHSIIYHPHASCQGKILSPVTTHITVYFSSHPLHSPLAAPHFAYSEGMKGRVNLPAPGVEPNPTAWETVTLTTRPHRQIVYNDQCPASDVGTSMIKPRQNPFINDLDITSWSYFPFYRPPRLWRSASSRGIQRVKMHRFPSQSDVK